MNQIRIEVDGIPPAKNEAVSLLGKGHRHIDRVRALLAAAHYTASTRGFRPFQQVSLRMEVTVYAPDGMMLPDATNLLGGISDTLQARKPHVRRPLDHLGELAAVHLYDEDANINQIAYQRKAALEPRYTVRFTAIE